jgi:enediyne biosynthesis protein E9
VSVFDVVIVGSGFGGAVMAARLGAELASGGYGQRRVLVVEKGDDHDGGFDPRAASAGFENTLDPRYLVRIAELYTDPRGAFRSGVPSMNVAAGRGIGGGSNVYCGVSLRAPSSAFEQVRAGRRLWPSSYTRASLDPYYARVEQRLRVRRLAWTELEGPRSDLVTKRDLVFAEGCRRVGATAVPLKVACEGDAGDGWWSTGQRLEGRQNLTKNYLADARSAGVLFWSSCDVERIAPSGSGYVVRGVDRRGAAAVPFEVECKLLVVAAGAVASTALLLRSQDEFSGDRRLDPHARLGKEVSANGDMGVTGIVGPDFERAVESFRGKPMATFCPSFWREHQFLLIPFYCDPLWLALGQPSTLLRPNDPRATGRASTTAQAGERDFGAKYKQRLRQFGPRMLTMGCLTFDEGEGEIRLSARGAAEVAWTETLPATERRWSAACSAMRRIYEALGGEMYLDAYRKDGTVSTSHPLGGCRMTSRDDPSGVVDEVGEHLTNSNLFVVDGAIVPSALGANPSLSIAAISERIADRIVAGDGTPSLADRLA